MNVISESGCQSIVGIVLTYYTHIVENVLNSLDNSELLKCKYVCKFWKRIADKIMNGRIIVIKRNIPYHITRMAVTEPQRLRCFHFQPQQRDQFLAEFNFNYIKEYLKTENVSSTNCKIMTEIVMFPLLPGIKVERFQFDTEHMWFTSEKRKAYLKELINLPKEELKCILWFTNEYSYGNGFPDFGIPSLLLSTSEYTHKFGESKNCAITFSGKRVNTVMLKIMDKFPYGRIKSKFMREITKVKDNKLDPYKCVALIFTNEDHTLQIQNNILFLFKETFPNIPVLLFSEEILMDIPTFRKTTYREEDYWILSNYYIKRTDVAVIKILLIWLN